MAVTETPYELDLSDESVAGGGPPVPRTEPYDPRRDQEKVRGWFAYIVLAMFVFVVLTAMASAIFASKDAWAQVAAALGLILSPVVGLVGAVTGFYYGEKSGRP